MVTDSITDSLAYIRERYGVPARRGVRVCYAPGSAHGHPMPPPVLGTINGASNGWLVMRPDSGQGYRNGYRMAPHPTWKVEDLDEGDVVGISHREIFEMTVVMLHEAMGFISDVAQGVCSCPRVYLGRHKSTYFVGKARAALIQLESEERAR